MRSPSLQSNGLAIHTSAVAVANAKQAMHKKKCKRQKYRTYNLKGNTFTSSVKFYGFASKDRYSFAENYDNKGENTKQKVNITFCVFFFFLLFII